MINIGSRTGQKIGILLILTTLTIGSAAGASWLEPDSDEHDSDVRLSVDAANSIDNVTWEVTGPNGEHSIDTNSETDGNYSVVFDKGNDADGTHGDYEFEPHVYNGSDVETLSSKTLTLDSKPPSIEFGDSEYVGDDPTISVDIGDEHTGVDNISASADNDANVDDISDNNCDAGETCTVEFDIDTGDVDEGDSFNLDITATDDVGNEGSNDQSFTLDTSYDGDDNPSFSVEDESEGVVFFDDDKDLTVDFGDADSTSDTTVTCYVEDEDVDSFTVSSGDDDPDEDDTTCEIPHDDDADYYGSSAEIYLEMEDEAGNTAESDSETVGFDVNPPSVTGLELPSNAELYNSDFDVEFSAFDSASDVEEVEYYFDEDTDRGEGNSIDYSSDEDTYTIDTSNLNAGDHTLYVRAQDQVSRWSSAESVDFSFDPNAVPEISLSVPENVSVTAGQQGSFDVTVENTGDIHISSIEVSGSAGDVFSDSQSISNLEPGDSITATLNVDTDSSHIGMHTLEISSDSPSRTEEINLVVEANSEQQDQIDSDLSEYQSTLQELESNVTSLKQQVSENNRQRLDSNFSEFKQKVEDAQSAVESGDYYKAESILEGIEEDRSAAESSYETVKQEYENSQFWMLIFLGLGGLVVLGGGAIGALSYTDEVGFDVRDHIKDLQETELDLSGLEGFVDKIKRKFEGKDTSDAEDFEWDGFNNQ